MLILCLSPGVLFFFKYTLLIVCLFMYSNALTLLVLSTAHVSSVTRHLNISLLQYQNVKSKKDK